MQYLCDTNIISELAKVKPNKGVLEWAYSVKTCAVSVITIEEIFYGFSWKPNIRVQAWINEFIDKYSKVLPVTESIAKQAGILRGRFQAKGISRMQADMLIAATASEHGLTIVTRNTDDFEGCSAALLNPFN